MHVVPIGSLVFALLCAAAAPVFAQQPTPQRIQEILRQVQEHPETYQRAFEQAREMQACLSRLPPDTLDRLRARGAEMLREVRALCAAGERDLATSRAEDYAREMASSPDLRAIAACGRMASQLIADLPFTGSAATRAGGEDHVCDRLPAADP